MISDEQLKARDAKRDIGTELLAAVRELTTDRVASNTEAIQRLGIAKGAFQMPDSIDSHNEEVARLFLGQA